jgi:four helix bundle protein
MTFKRFEEIEAWQLAREICRIVKRLTDKPEFSKDWELRKQMRNSAGTTMDCIAEGHERGNNAEFKYFLGVSQGSCGELRSQGYRALDYHFINEEELKELHTMSFRTSAALRGLIEYLNQTEIKGFRYNPKKKEKEKAKSNDPYFPSQEPPTQP